MAIKQIATLEKKCKRLATKYHMVGRKCSYFALFFSTCLFLYAPFKFLPILVDTGLLAIFCIFFFILCKFCSCDKKIRARLSAFQGELTMMHYYSLLLLLLIISLIITMKILTEIGLDVKPLNILFHTLRLAFTLQRELTKDYKIG